MKLIIQGDRIAATVIDDYTGPDAHMPAPEDFDPARLGDYRVIAGALTLPGPQACTPAQGLIALYALQSITEEDIATAIAAIPDPVQRYSAQIGYTRATTWERTSATMQAMAVLLGLSESDLDALFTYAAGVQV